MPDINASLPDHLKAEASRELLQEIIHALEEYTVIVHGPQMSIPLGVDLLQVNEGIPIAWQFAAYIEQNWMERENE